MPAILYTSCRICSLVSAAARSITTAPLYFASRPWHRWQGALLGSTRMDRKVWAPACREPCHSPAESRASGSKAVPIDKASVPCFTIPRAFTTQILPIAAVLFLMSESFWLSSLSFFSAIAAVMHCSTRPLAILLRCSIFFSSSLRSKEATMTMATVRTSSRVITRASVNLRLMLIPPPRIRGAFGKVFSDRCRECLPLFCAGPLPLSARRGYVRAPDRRVFGSTSSRFRQDRTGDRSPRSRDPGPAAAPDVTGSAVP